MNNKKLIHQHKRQKAEVQKKKKRKKFRHLLNTGYFDKMVKREMESRIQHNNKKPLRTRLWNAVQFFFINMTRRGEIRRLNNKNDK